MPLDKKPRAKGYTWFFYFTWHGVVDCVRTEVIIKSINLVN